MSKFQQLLLLANSNANFFDVKPYTGPYIFDAGGKLTDAKGKPVRWFVYYNYRNPDTGKFERQNHVYTGVNKFKKLADRRKAIRILRDAVEGILENGYNPYTDEPAFKHEIREYNVVDAVEFVLELKKGTMSESGYPDFRSRVYRFRDWLLVNGFANLFMSAVTRKAVNAYLNTVQLATSAKNRNNTRTAIQSLFETLEENEIVPVNFVSKIAVLTTRPERNKTYTPAQDKDIFSELQQNYPDLFLFVKFVAFGMLRPLEICRLTVKDLDAADAKVYLRAKNKPVKIKIIPRTLLEDLPDLSGLDTDSFLITRFGIGKDWPATEGSKRDYWTDLFKKVKDKLGLDQNYGMYSFRHTYITKLYRSFRATHTPWDAKTKLMMITGHQTMAALDKYLRDIDAELPEDFSEHFK